MKKLTRTVPPKRGPNPQGLNVPLKQVKIINPENINGRYRQVVTKRKNINRGWSSRGNRNRDSFSIQSSLDYNVDDLETFFIVKRSQKKINQRNYDSATLAHLRLNVLLDNDPSLETYIQYTKNPFRKFNKRARKKSQDYIKKRKIKDCAFRNRPLFQSKWYRANRSRKI